jgi:hypothetical protein
MTTKSKKKKHALNPIIILSFIVIGLLFVILTIAMKENIDVNGNLKASVSQCSDLTKDGGKAIVGEGTGAGALLAKQAAYADAKEKFNTWWTTSTSLGGTDGTGKEQTEKALANELDCAKDRPQCQQEKNARVTCLPTQSADCSYTTSTNTTPISAIASCTFGIRCSNACENIKEDSTTTPLPFPRCIKSGPRSNDGNPNNDCNPNSEGMFRVESSKTGTATKDEASNQTAQVALAKSRAITNAQAELDTKCKDLATNDPMYKCTAILAAQGIPNHKGCVDGCEANIKSVYNPPYIPLTSSGNVGGDTAADCTIATQAVASPSPPGSITINATCYAACTYKQDCVPVETTVPPVTDPFTSPLPSTTAPSR